MRKRFRNSKERIEFCERAGKVDSADRRRSLIVEQTRDRALLVGWKVV
jgi:hypothetical protein